ncbi:pyrroloquinoline quinone biosynthesis peptide chaperone PqqD [Saccharothrix violaceirubra]|uniref:Pyrroloquinoline quinone biosynthesis protein D n=1 Tax=Saccharothrix violaceirubra TaxID=413306 RepID=A0A7W7T8X7_9PSEU|nr:pyrroloquinoline quinone biosynthesis peptide chaperone PqqD [Saccharothrix violaceirubra]MBB4968516.1 pyrroloquinoline quinone biosynthesis protein D [Saccharothrix violaceirubra]
MTGPDSVPRLRKGVKVAFDDVRSGHVVLFPEGVLVLNDTAAAVIALCDGVASVRTIADRLAVDYAGVEPADVAELVDRLADRRVVDVDG